MRLMRVALVAVLVSVGLAQAGWAAEPQFARHFGPEHKQLFAVNDPLPHLQRVLTSASLRRTLVEGPFGQMFRKWNPNEDLDPAKGWQFVRQNERWVPSEFAIGVEDSGMQAIDSFFRLLILSEVGRAAAGIGDDAARAEAGRVEALALADVKRLDVPAMRIYARMRQADDAAALVALAGAQLKQADLPPAVKLVVGEKRVTLAARVGDLVEERVIAAFMRGLGVATADDAPATREMARVIARLNLQVALEAVGDGMVLTIGRPPTGGPLTAADLGPQFRWEAGDVLWSRWDLTQLKGWANGWVKLWGQWENTKVGAAARKLDENAFLDSLAAMVRQLQGWGATGQARVWVEADSALKARVEEHGVARSPSLLGDPLVKLVPATAEAYNLTTSASAGDLVAGALLDVEGRMEMQSLKAEWAEKPNATGDMAARMLAGYYGNFSEFRSLILERSVGLFEPGAAWMIGTRGTVPRFALRLDDGKEKVAFEGRDLPMMEFALVGRPKDVTKVDPFMRDLSASIAKGFLASAGVTPGKLDLQLRQEDLGLGRPTWAFRGDFIEEVAKAKGVKALLAMEGDLQPHYFVVNDHLVFSTSVRLSREIVAAATGTQAAVVPPAQAQPQGDERLIGFGRFPGDTIAKYMEHMGAWMAVFVKDRQLDGVFRGMGDLIRLVREMRWEDVQQGERQTRSAVVTFR